ncbi:MAG TPA: hypothetical protein VGN16_08425, partial [Acidobacteriaceae bacterium]
MSINGSPLSAVNWDQNSNSTSLASALASVIQTAQPSWSVVPSGGSITLQSSAGSNIPVSVSVSDTAGMTASFSASASGLSGGNGPTGSTNVVYSYAIPSGGYAANGNILSYNDSVNGSWTFGYDTLNRLLSGSASFSAAPSQAFCWSYDSFGNRLAQGVAASNPNQPCASTSGGWTNMMTVTYDANNRITKSGFIPAPTSNPQDAAGNLTMDMVPSPQGTSNNYIYDAEDRICASIAGSVRTQYIYDAEGHRVAKGSIGTASCDTTSNSFSETSAYVIGHSGEQMTEISSGQWKHTNLGAGDALLATYDGNG